MITKKSKTKKKSSLKKKATKKPVRKVAKKVPAIPKGYHSITPYLIVKQAAKAIEFYKKIFTAKEVMRMERPDGKIAHAELKIGDAKIMLADECPEMGAVSPKTTGGCAMSIHLYTKNVDSVADHAVAAGAKLLKPVENMFYGDRSGMLEDPYGHTWCISTHIEHVTPAQIRKRAAELFG